MGVVVRVGGLMGFKHTTIGKTKKKKLAYPDWVPSENEIQPEKIAKN
jgi:hypothetical protein